MSAPAAAAEAVAEGTPVEVQPQVTVTETVAADAQIAAINSNIRSLMNMVNGFALTLDRESRLRREAEEHNQEEFLRLQNDFIMGRSPSSEGIAPPREELRNSRTVPSLRTSMHRHPQELMENTVIRVQKEVPEDLKVRVLSYKSVIFAEKNMLAWQSANQDPTKKIQDFLTPSVQLELVQNEQRLQRPMCEFLTLATLQDAQPATIIDMIARKLRPLTTTNYYDTVAETVQVPLPKTRDWTFGFEGYDLELHAAVAKTVEQARSLHSLISLNALDEDTLLWPKICWGTKDRSGLLRVYLKILGKYEVHFLERITEPALKAMESVTELLDAIVRVNHELCTMARTLTAKAAQFHKPPERAAADGPLPQYDPGDLVLWEQRESPSDFLPEKLAPSYLGPYKVLAQRKNDVSVEHVVLGTPHVLHVGRLKPFVGSHEDAIRVGRADQHQVFIVSINYFTGNPHVRSSMSFNVTFEDGTIDLPYNPDLAASQQFQDYVATTPDLYPLRFTAAAALTQIRRLNKLSITSIAVGDHGYLSLRFFDGLKSAWFDSLQLPQPTHRYVVPFTAKRFNTTHTVLVITVPLFTQDYKLLPYDVLAHTVADINPDLHLLVTSHLLGQHPRIVHG